MPELPEVQTIVDSLKEAKIENLSIKEVLIFLEKLIVEPSSKDFKKIIIDKKIIKIDRRAKYILFTLSEGYTLLVHLRMTGRFFLSDSSKKREKHEHLQIVLSNGQLLSFFDTRQFAKIILTTTPEKHLTHLGPEPLSKDFTLKSFKEKLKTSKRKIKSILLDQTFLAGLGNIYTDEALWEAKIHPKKPGFSLNNEEAQILFEVIKKVLLKGIKNKGTSLGSLSLNYADIHQRFGGNQHFLKAYQQLNKQCQRCHNLIVREKINQRSSFFCPTCQKI